MTPFKNIHTPIVNFGSIVPSKAYRDKKTNVQTDRERDILRTAVLYDGQSLHFFPTRLLGMIRPASSCET
jgi:hypothetical protein